MSYVQTYFELCAEVIMYFVTFVTAQTCALAHTSTFEDTFYTFELGHIYTCVDSDPDTCSDAESDASFGADSDIGATT